MFNVLYYFCHICLDLPALIMQIVPKIKVWLATKMGSAAGHLNWTVKKYGCSDWMVKKTASRTGWLMLVCTEHFAKLRHVTQMYLI